MTYRDTIKNRFEQLLSDFMTTNSITFESEVFDLFALETLLSDMQLLNVVDATITTAISDKLTAIGVTSSIFDQNDYKTLKKVFDLFMGFG